MRNKLGIWIAVGIMAIGLIVMSIATFTIQRSSASFAILEGSGAVIMLIGVAVLAVALAAYDRGRPKRKK
jgi:peptidoglycan/LPS O-acetylase OafA/YrhL